MTTSDFFLSPFSATAPHLRKSPCQKFQELRSTIWHTCRRLQYEKVYILLFPSCSFWSHVMQIEMEG